MIRSLTFALTLATGVTVTPVATHSLRVVDGDTIVYNKFTYRLAAYDAPEIRGARCVAEFDRGMRARDRLRDLLAGPYTLTLVLCANRKLQDKYGRYCATARVAGEDVGSILVRERLAVRFGSGKPDWCNRGERR